MPLIIDQPEQQDLKFPVDHSITLPPQAVEHGLGIDHNPNYTPAIPEPGEYASVFGALLLALAVIRRLRTIGRVAPVLLAVGAAQAADVNFAWNPSPSVGVTNYALYISTTQITATNFKTAPFRVNAGTNLTATFADAQPGTYWVTATAQGDKLESPPSGILVFEMPAPPPNLRTVVYQYSTTLTNWQDVGYFKLKIP